MPDGTVKDVATVATGGDVLFDPIQGAQVRDVKNQLTRAARKPVEIRTTARRFSRRSPPEPAI